MSRARPNKKEPCPVCMGQSLPLTGSYLQWCQVCGCLHDPDKPDVLYKPLAHSYIENGDLSLIEQATARVLRYGDV